MLRHLVATFFFALLFVSAGASEATSPLPASICATADRLINVNLRVLAKDNFSGIGDNSAPRETNRLLRQVAAWQQIEILMLQKNQSKCPAYPDAIDPGAFTAQAIGCQTEMIRWNGGPLPDSCDISKWQSGRP